MITASIFVAKGFKVYLFDEVVPTPIVAFTVIHKNCSCGIMITASHNPKDDNGYKVYWENGCQIIEPHDAGIRQKINENLEPWKLPDGIEADDSLYKNDLVIDPSESIDAYYEKVKSKWCFYPNENSKSALNIAYTAMHGVGPKYFQNLWSKFGFKPLVITKEQDKPDPDFPTVAFPNPEEGKGSLKLAIENADRNNCTLILAHDPDADRLAVAEKLQDGSWHIFTGNEIGILLADWIVTNYIRTHPNIKDHKKLLLLNSTVSSKMIASLARKKGLTYVETLTGFKWIGNKALSMEQNEGYITLFGFEEAIGFMVGGISWDKDGISAGCVFGEMASYYQREEGKTCLEKLNQLRNECGLYLTKNSYFFCYDPEKVKIIFDEIRNNGKYIESCGKYKITSIRDLTSPGYDSKTKDNIPTLPVSSSSQMITFEFENGAVATLRGSGTEPKLKYYVEICGENNVDEVQRSLDDLVENIIETLLKPKKFELIPPKED